ncbi:phosphatase PAP2 family protein [Pseudonocardia sp. Cha107L01]|jgi:undecaprenyl-diphosphatase|uniref:phosphatase PAP2 family protein n=1 Tax=Pseudonocardia sp. Cha107L01 TaxID=3457576 RepID=UPI00403E8BAD
MPSNIQLLLTINALARSTPWLQTAMSSYATVAGFVVFAELMLAGWWFARQRSDPRAVAATLWTPIGMLLALAVNQPITAHFAERRPYMVYPDLLTLAQHSLAPGFPSDHAVIGGAVTATLFLASRRLGYWTALAALVMAFARIYIAAAYPYDVLAGLLLGAAVSLVSFLLVRRPLVRLLGAADQTVFRPLITATPRTALAGSAPGAS